MADLEIDREDIHDRKKWIRNVMKRKSILIENGLFTNNNMDMCMDICYVYRHLLCVWTFVMCMDICYVYGHLLCV